MNIPETVDYLVNIIETSVNRPGGVRSAAPYQLMVQLRDKLLEAGMSRSVAEQVVANITIELPVDFHDEYPEEFQKIVDTFTIAIVNMYHAVKEDFEDYTTALISFSKDMNISLGV